MNIVNILKTAS